MSDQDDSKSATMGEEALEQVETPAEGAEGADDGSTPDGAQEAAQPEKRGRGRPKKSNATPVAPPGMCLSTHADMQPMQAANNAGNLVYLLLAWSFCVGSYASRNSSGLCQRFV